MKMKQWEKPKLIVLVRSRPEEAILDSCKAELIAHQGPGNYCGLCQNADGAPCDTWSNT